MQQVNVIFATGTRKGANALLNEDAIGVNGWVLAADQPGTFPPWGQGQARSVVTPTTPLVIVVADGVGGARGSIVASRMVAELTSRIDVARGRSGLEHAIARAHTEIHAIQQQPGTPSDGATMVGCIIHVDGALTCFNVGDSRCYYTNGSTLVQLSQDHTERISSYSPVTQLTHWMGHPDREEIQAWITPLAPTDMRWLLLCSDGLHTSVDAQVLEDIVCADASGGPAEKVSQLLKAATDSPDDVTVIVALIQVIDQGEPDRPAHAPQAVDEPALSSWSRGWGGRRKT